MSRFPNRPSILEQGAANTGQRRLGSRDRRLPDTVGVRVPGLVQRAGVAPIAGGTQPDTLADILARATVTAGQAVRVERSQRAQAEHELIGEGDSLGVEAGSSIEASILAGERDDLLEIEAGDAVDRLTNESLGVGADANLRRGFEDRIRGRTAGALETRRRGLLATARRESTERLVAAASRAGSDEDLAEIERQIRETNPGFTDRDAASALLPALQEAAVTGDQERFDRLAGRVETALPTETAQNRLRLEAAIEAGREDEIDADAVAFARLNEERRLSGDFAAFERGVAELSSPERFAALVEAARDREFVERIDETENRLTVAVARGDAEAFERELGAARRQFQQAGQSDASFDVFALDQTDRFARAQEQRERGAARDAVRRAQRLFAGGDAAAAEAALRVRGAIDTPEGLRLLGDIDEASFTESLIRDDLQALSDPDIPSNAQTLIPATMTRRDGRVVTISGDQRAENARNAYYEVNFGGRNPIRDFITGASTDEAAINQQLRFHKASGASLDPVFQSIRGQVTGIGETAEDVPASAVRAIVEYRRLQENNMAADFDNGSIGSQAIIDANFLIQDQVTNSPEEALARVTNVLRRIEAGDLPTNLGLQSGERLDFDDLPGHIERSIVLRDRAARNAEARIRYYGLDPKLARKQAIEQIERDTFRYRGTAVDMRGMDLYGDKGENTFRQLAGILEGYELSRDEDLDPDRFVPQYDGTILMMTDRQTGMPIGPDAAGLTRDAWKQVLHYDTTIQSRRNFLNSRGGDINRPRIMDIDLTITDDVDPQARPIIEWLLSEDRTKTERRRREIEATSGQDLNPYRIQ